MNPCFIPPIFTGLVDGRYKDYNLRDFNSNLKVVKEETIKNQGCFTTLTNTGVKITLEKSLNLI